MFLSGYLPATPVVLKVKLGMVWAVIALIVVVVLIALAIDAPKTLLTASVLYALSGPLLWFRRRKLPAQDAAA